MREPIKKNKMIPPVVPNVYPFIILISSKSTRIRIMKYRIKRTIINVER